MKATYQRLLAITELTTQINILQFTTTNSKTLLVHFIPTQLIPVLVFIQ